MPTNRWTYRLNLGDIFHAEHPTFEQRRDRIVERIKRQRWFTADDRSMFLDDIVDELADAETTAEFDQAWDLFYDYADGERIWVETTDRRVSAAVER